MKNNNQAKTWFIKVKKIIYYLLGILEVLFAFRLVFKVLGANPDNEFVNVIYRITNIFLKPFEGIFSTTVKEGMETKAILEPSLLIAIVVYAVLAWGIIKLIEVIGNK